MNVVIKRCLIVTLVVILGTSPSLLCAAVARTVKSPSYEMIRKTFDQEREGNLVYVCVPQRWLPDCEPEGPWTLFGLSHAEVERVPEIERLVKEDGHNRLGIILPWVRDAFHVVFSELSLRWKECEGIFLGVDEERDDFLDSDANRDTLLSVVEAPTLSDDDSFVSLETKRDFEKIVALIASVKELDAALWYGANESEDVFVTKRVADFRCSSDTASPARPPLRREEARRVRVSHAASTAKRASYATPSDLKHALSLFLGGALHEDGTLPCCTGGNSSEVCEFTQCVRHGKRKLPLVYVEDELFSLVVSGWGLTSVNELSSLVPAGTAINILDISGNCLEGLPSYFFNKDQFKNIFLLYARNNSFTEVGMVGNAFIGAEDLCFIDLSDNRDLGRIPTGLEVCSSLYTLDLTNCGLTELPEKLGEKLPALRVLQIGDNNLQELPEGLFASGIDKKEVRLGLAGNRKLKNILLQVSAYANELEMLAFDGTAVGDKEECALEEFCTEHWIERLAGGARTASVSKLSRLSGRGLGGSRIGHVERGSIGGCFSRSRTGDGEAGKGAAAWRLSCEREAKIQAERIKAKRWRVRFAVFGAGTLFVGIGIVKSCSGSSLRDAISGKIEQLRKFLFHFMYG